MIVGIHISASGSLSMSEMLINPDGTLQTLPGCGSIKFCGEAILTCQKTSEDWLVDDLNLMFISTTTRQQATWFPLGATPANDGPDCFFDYHRDLCYLELIFALASDSNWNPHLFSLPILTDGTKKCIQITSEFDFEMLVGAVSRAENYGDRNREGGKDTLKPVSTSRTKSNCLLVVLASQKKKAHVGSRNN
ncbi:hypothetical protein C8R48DRAFT_760781 [Suillus tomentosus]|nr:hypothetical protein C8R48DRAFT_760781 [Suillus tomentosus]